MVKLSRLCQGDIKAHSSSFLSSLMFHGNLWFFFSAASQIGAQIRRGVAASIAGHPSGPRRGEALVLRGASDKNPLGQTSGSRNKMIRWWNGVTGVKTDECVYAYIYIHCYILNDIKRHYRLYTVYHSAQHTRIPCVGTLHLQVEGLRQDVVFHVLASGMTSMLGFSREWGWRSWETAFCLIVVYQVQTSRIQAKPMFTFCFTFLYTVWHGFAICHRIQECASLCKSQERQRDLAELMDIAKQRDAGDKGSFCKFWASLMRHAKQLCQDSVQLCLRFCTILLV